MTAPSPGNGRLLRALLRIVAADWPEDLTIHSIGATAGLNEDDVDMLRDALGDRRLRDLLE